MNNPPDPVPDWNDEGDAEAEMAHKLMVLLKFYPIWLALGVLLFIFWMVVGY